MKNFFERSEAQKGLFGVSAGINSSECLLKSIDITSPSLPNVRSLWISVPLWLRYSTAVSPQSHRGGTEVHRESLLSCNSANFRQRATHERLRQWNFVLVLCQRLGAFESYLCRVRKDDSARSLTGQIAFGFCHPPRNRSYAAQNQTRFTDSLVWSFCDGCGHGRHRKIHRVALFEFQICRVRGKLRCRYLDFGNYFVILEHVLAPQVSFRRQSEKLVQGTRTLALRTDYENACAQRDEHWRQV